MISFASIPLTHSVIKFFWPRIVHSRRGGNYGSRILLLTPYPFGQAPSQRFRFEQYLDVLRQEGFDVQFHSFLSDEGWEVLYKRGHFAQKSVAILRGFLQRLGLFFGPVFRADIVFIHREAAPIGPPFIEFIIARLIRKPVVYDFDDAIWLPNTSEENRFVGWFKWHSKVSSICRWSHRVSAGNDYLAEFARQYNSNVVVNPTTIDCTRIHVPALVKTEEKPYITLGWTGTHSTLKYLDAFEPVWANLVSRFGTGIKLLIIADRQPNYAWPQWEFIRWSRETEVQDLRRIDIGLMPLTIDRWTEGKCGLKVLQYMALSIPAVASPAGVNTKIIRHAETGLLCDSPDQWEESIAQLIRDPVWRKALSEAGRQHVVNFYSVDSNRSNFISLFR